MVQTQNKKRKYIPTEKHKRKISNTMKKGYATGKYDKPVGNTMRHYRGPRPWAWKHGPDPVLRTMARAWIMKKVQAKFRGEGWKFVFSDFVRKWKGQWANRKKDKLWLCRLDNTRPWSYANTAIMTRKHHVSRMMRQYHLNKSK
jgi:hypothetical protein